MDLKFEHSISCSMLKQTPENYKTGAEEPPRWLLQDCVLCSVVEPEPPFLAGAVKKGRLRLQLYSLSSSYIWPHV